MVDTGKAFADAHHLLGLSYHMLGQSERLMAAVIVTCAAGIVLLGGMRSLTWASVAKAIAALYELSTETNIALLSGEKDQLSVLLSMWNALAGK